MIETTIIFVWMLLIFISVPGWSQMKRPNIILIISDSHRSEALGVAGNPFVQTPHLDKLANEGTRFENAYVTSAICMASRASILSGQYMSRHMITDFATDFSDEGLLNTYPLLLRSSGYQIALIGVWGVGNNPPSTHFDHWESNIPWRTQDGVHQTDNIVQRAVAFLENYQSAAPFYLSVGFSAAHEIDPSNGNPATYEVQERYQNLYDGVSIPVPETAAPIYWNSLPDFFHTDQNIARARWQGFFSSPELFQKNARNYYSMVTGLDDAVGVLLEKLKDLGLDKNTIVIYTSDHGFSLNEHGLMGKWFAYEKSIRVPLIIYDPRNPKVHGKVAKQIALNLDVAPTILKLANVDVPSEMQGIDLIEMVSTNKKSLNRKEFFYEHGFLGSPQLPESHAVVRVDIKYIYYPEHQFEEVYDLKKDPNEKVNVANSPKYSEKVKKLRRSYVQLNQFVK